MSFQQKIPVPHANSRVNNTHWEVTIDSVAHLLKTSEDFLLLDCRSREEWEENRIPDAMNLPLQQFSTRCHELENHRDRPIVVYCRTGRRSAILAKFLHLSGYPHVRSMAGGIEAWQEQPGLSSRD